MNSSPTSVPPDSENLWIQNLAWRGRAGLAHGCLTRRGLLAEGKIPLSRAVTIAAPRFGELIATAGGAADLRGIKLLGMDQVHGDAVAVVSGARGLERADAMRLGAEGEGSELDYFVFPATDAMATNLRNHLLIVQTADCLPILFDDPTNGVIGACHCGWKGTLARLARKTAEAMIGLGARAEAIEAWIGPGICEANYEVGAELAGRFAEAFPSARISGDGMRLNLAAAARAQLIEAGLAEGNIFDSGRCTFAEPEALHSYRREGAQAGRLLTVIGRVE